MSESQTESCRDRHPEEIRHRVGRIPGRTRAPSPRRRGVPSLTLAPINWSVLPGPRVLRWLQRWPGPPAEKELTCRSEEEPVKEGRKSPSF